ncbi:MAG: Rrf2 family transcriptional regulator [Candidatus Omnitrophica bacterium]|nr:Rrf2 family transcriptional regulator [Candidatus Omnitrophota bacterium]
MKLINKNTDYAVQALFYISQKTPNIISTVEVEKQLNLPRPFIRKILQNLTKAGYLSSSKGSGGGFTIARPLDDIYLLDLMQLFQGRLAFTDCSFQKKVCPNAGHCPLRRRIKTIEDTVLHELKGVSLAELTKK